MVVVVTRAGEGRVIRFPSVIAADSHPVTQYGDPIITQVFEVRQCLTRAECARVARSLGDVRLSYEILMEPPRSGLMEDLWRLIEQKAPSPPDDPAEVCRIITEDRCATRSRGIHLRPRGEYEMTEIATENLTPAIAAAAPTTKTRPIPKEPKHADTSVIQLLTDKEGKTYGPDHNPKKVGSASHERFAKYVDGMTVKDAIAAGVQRGDLDNDIKHKYIELH